MLPLGPSLLLCELPAGATDLAPDTRASQPAGMDQPIGQEALELLEWPRLGEHLATFASTSAGGALCARLPLGANLEDSRRRLAETTELLGLDGLSEGGLSFQQGRCGLGLAPAIDTQYDAVGCRGCDGFARRARRCRANSRRRRRRRG